MMQAFELETERLILTKMGDNDQDKYYRLSNNPNVMKYVTGYALNREESDEMLRAFLIENEGDVYLGRYFIEGRQNGELIGAAKLDRVGNEIEIGYRIQEEYWGRGVATEVAKGLISFAKNTLRESKIIAFVNVTNAASIRVLEKAGMKNIETIVDLDEVRYKFSYTPETNSMMKKALYTILGIVAMFLIAALIMPKGYEVEREIVINRPKADVFQYLRMLKNQDHWSVWMSMDPKIKKSFKGTDGTVGYTSMWDGNGDVGVGEQEIKKIEEGERIDTELRFLKPFQSTSNAYMITERVSDTETKVKWGFTGVMPFPMNVILPFLGMEKALGKDFSDGLSKLKGILEK